MATDIITDVGEQKIALASGSASSVVIREIALGDGLGSTYEPTFNQTSLKRELARLPFDSRHIVDANSWRVKVEFPPETPAFSVREMGFFDDDGDLIALWAGANISPRQTGSIAYLIDHVLSFTRVADGLIIVDAPDDVTFDLAVTTALAITNLQHQQLIQAEAIYASTGKYPGGSS